METKKYFILFNILVLWMFSTVHASPLISVGNYTNIFFNASFAGIWQSNILYEDENEEDDIFFVFTPGLEASFGSGSSNFDLNLAVDYDIQRYDELSEFDREYLSARAIGSYKTARWSLDGSASFLERYSTSGQERLTNNNVDREDDLILIDDILASLNGTYKLSPKSSFEAGVRYLDREYTNNDQLADRETFKFPVDVFYELTPKVDLSFGYQFETSEVGRSVFPLDETTDLLISSHDMEVHFLNLGARGKLLPKLEGFFKVGYRAVDPEDSTTVTTSSPTTSTVKRDSQSILGLDADFTYLVTPKLTSYLNLYRGFDVGSEGQTTQNSSVDINADYVISGNYIAGSFFRYTLREFEDGPSTGEDNVYDIGIRLSYVPDDYLRFNAGYTYSKNDSDRERQDYVNNIVSLSASFRY